MRKATAMVYGWTLAGMMGLLWGPQLGLVGCTNAASAQKPTDLMVFFSNETENELYKCGCRSNQAGGLSRRATIFAQQEAYPELVVDAGNFSAKRPDSEYDNYKMDYLIRIYDMLGYHALNAGPQEFTRGKEKLVSLAKATGDRMVSANIVDSDKKLVLPPFRVVNISGLKVGVIGLITEQFFPNPQNPSDALATIDAQEAFKAQWDELKGTTDIQVVLSQLRDDEIQMLVKSYPEIDVIVGGPGWQGHSEMAPKEIEGVPYGKVGQRGKYIGQIHLELAQGENGLKVGKYEGEAIQLGDAVPYNERVEQVLEEFKEKLRTGEAPYQDIYDPHTEGAQFRYSGSINCQNCHSAIYAGWLKTRHSQAFQTLQMKGEQNNPECLQCHTVGYNDAGGYRAKGNSYLLANVQCESCHGPAADHADLASRWQEGRIKEKPTDWKIEFVNTPQTTCVSCHNPDNDPHWTENDTVWPFETMKAQVGCSQWTAGIDPATQGAASTVIGHEQPGHVHGAPTPPAGGAPPTPPAGGGH